MFTQKILLGFTHYTDAAMEAKATDIIAAMTGNPNFPHPDPDLSVVQADLDKYSTDRVASSTGNHAAVVAKNSSRKALQVLLAQLGMWIMSVAKGNADMLATTGYTLSKKPEPRHIKAAGNVSISNGLSSGQLVASIAALNGALGYQFEITDATPGDKSVWVSNVASTSKYTFKNLVPGRQYWIRVAVTGARQQVQYSNVGSKFAQ